MAQMEQQPILKMEVTDNCVSPEHLVCDKEVRISLIVLVPSRNFIVA
jgi:hypothetical protein